MNSPLSARPLASVTAATTLLLGLISSAPVVGASESFPAAAAVNEADPAAETVPGRIVVSWDSTTPESARAEVRDRHGLSAAEQLEGIDAEVVTVPAGSAERITAALNVEPTVFVAEPDFIIESTTDDPGYSQLWGLHNTSDVDIDAPEAWATTRGDADVIVAVIDTGVDVSHPDLRDNIWTNPGETPANGIDDDRNGYVDDVHGWDFANGDASVYDGPSADDHGTHVAGTIAASADNGRGVAGVAPNVTIMPVKFLDAEGAGSSSAAAAAVSYAYANGASVINASWGGGGGFALENAIRSASGAVLVAGAGNDGVDMDSTAPRYPAAWAADGEGMPNVVSVASVDSNGSLSHFSNYGLRTVDVGAPGGRIVSTLPGGYYGTMSGTSMAAPHVSGVAALVASIDGALTGAELGQAVKAGAQSLSSLRGRTSTGGLANAPASLTAASTTVSTPVPTDESAREVDSEPATDVEPPPAAEEPPPYDGRGARSLDRACPGVVDSGFSDVLDGSVHAPGVGCAAAWRVFSGSSGTTFRPTDHLTRGQLASVLARGIEQAVGRALPEGADHFDDDDDSVHRSAIDKLADLGIVAGIDATTYVPGASVTRAQFASMLARTYGHLVGELPAGRDTFGDDDGLVHEPSIDGLASLGVVAGTADGRYEPRAALSRDQSATLVARLLDALVETGVVARRDA